MTEQDHKDIADSKKYHIEVGYMASIMRGEYVEPYMSWGRYASYKTGRQVLDAIRDFNKDLYFEYIRIRIY